VVAQEVGGGVVLVGDGRVCMVVISNGSTLKQANACETQKRGIRQYAAMTKKTYAGVCEGFDYFSPTGSWRWHWRPAFLPLCLQTGHYSARLAARDHGSGSGVG
jgi:hypothetical protein